MKQSNILLAAFQGEENSSKILLDKINGEYDKFLFSNDYTCIYNEICDLFDRKIYDTILLFGQKPLIKGLSIERIAKCKKEWIETNFPIKELCNILNKEDISYKLSKNSGTSYCNFLYYNMLKCVAVNHYPTKVVFIHVPFLNHFLEFEKVVHLFNS